MAAKNFKKAEEIFNNAIEIADPAKRAAYLEDTGKMDQELQSESEALLNNDTGKMRRQRAGGLRPCRPFSFLLEAFGVTYVYVPSYTKPADGTESRSFFRISLEI